MSGSGFAPLPPSIPQFAPSWRRRLCAALLRVCGWRQAGELPDVARLVVIAAPHSSWWDGLWGMLMKVALGIDLTFMGKRELFRGPLGWLLRHLGGIPVERQATNGVVEQMVARFQASPRLWLGLAPEGTRRAVTQWRSGFWHIAHEAGVPILPLYFDYASRTIGFGPLFHTTGDMDADIAALRAFYQPFRGRNRGV